MVRSHTSVDGNGMRERKIRSRGEGKVAGAAETQTKHNSTGLDYEGRSEAVPPSVHLHLKPAARDGVSSEVGPFVSALSELCLLLGSLAVCCCTFY